MSRLKGRIALASLLGFVASAFPGPEITAPRPEKPRRKEPNPEKQSAAEAKRARKAAKRAARINGGAE